MVALCVGDRGDVSLTMEAPGVVGEGRGEAIGYVGKPDGCNDGVFGRTSCGSSRNIASGSTHPIICDVGTAAGFVGSSAAGACGDAVVESSILHGRKGRMVAFQPWGTW